MIRKRSLLKILLFTSLSIYQAPANSLDTSDPRTIWTLGYYHGFVTGVCDLYNKGRISSSESFTAVTRFLSNYSDSTDPSYAPYKSDEMLKGLKEEFSTEEGLTDTCRYYFGKIETPPYSY